MDLESLFIFIALHILLFSEHVECRNAELSNKPLNGSKQFKNLETRSNNSIDACSMAINNKCYSIMPPDGSTPSNLIEEVGHVNDIQTCQKFCLDMYGDICDWFVYNRTTKDCRVFRGALNDSLSSCNEVGYSIETDHSRCDVAFDSRFGSGCLNFREDYCRFESSSLLENLEDIGSLGDCQLACSYISKCDFFLYDVSKRVCKLNTNAFHFRKCDIVHGSPTPDFQSCLDSNQVLWANATN